MYTFRPEYMCAFPLLISPCWFPFCSPFLAPLLTWNPPCCDWIRPPWSQVARKLIPSFPSLPICYSSVSHSEIPTPCGFPKLMRPFTKTTSQHWLPSPAHDYIAYSSQISVFFDPDYRTHPVQISVKYKIKGANMKWRILANSDIQTRVACFAGKAYHGSLRGIFLGGRDIYHP